MKFDENKMKKAQEEALEILQNSEDKAQGILDAMDKILSVQYEDLISEIVSQSNQSKSDEVYAQRMGLRALSQEEKDFYTKLKDVQAAITANQVDILPNTIIDLTLEDIKEESDILKDVFLTPADVKRWFTAEKNGTYSWGGLTAAITGELSATFNTLNFEVNKLSVYLIIPKAINDLALPFVDKYFRAILKEALNDGLEHGYLVGTGKNEPIGIYKKIGQTNDDGTHKDKEVHKLYRFSPKGLAAAKKYLTKDGIRTLGKLVLYCHPNDEADYVAPAIYNNEGKLVCSYKNFEVKTSCNNPQGKAALVIPKKYVMGLTGFGIKEYDQTKALDDADVVIGKAYSDGRAVDDNIAFVFDVTELKEYIPVVGTKEAEDEDVSL